MEVKKTEIIESSLYGGEVKIKFYPNSHAYKVTDEKNGLKDKRVKGVTTYLGIKDKSAPLVIWATELAGWNLIDKLRSGKVITEEDIMEAVPLHRKKLEEASNIGQKIHDWCEYFIKHNIGENGYEDDPILPDEKEILLGINSFLYWYNEHDVKFISSERIVYSRKEQAIGILDIEAKVDGKLALIDLKTSNGLYNAVRFQTATYVKFDEEENPDKKYDERWAIRLSKETEEEYLERQERNCFIRGKDPQYIKPYQALEVMRFDNGEELEKDYQAFLNSKGLKIRDDETDFFKNKK